MPSPFAPGTNLKREPPHAGWLYLLPTLEPTAVVCIGVPGIGTLRVLAARAGSITVMVVSRADHVRRARWESDARLAGVRWVRADDMPSEIPDGRADVLTALDPGATRWLSGNANRIQAAQNVVERGGTLVLHGRLDPGSALGRAVSCPRSALRTFRVLPLRGEPRVWVASEDEDSRSQVLSARLVHPWGSEVTPRFVDRFARRVPVPLAWGRRWATLIRGTHAATSLPGYLEAIASEAHQSLEGYRWWLSVPEGYRSRKVVFRLFGTSPSQPSMVVKIVSHPEMNSRLQNEARALAHLEAIGFSIRGRAPRVAFEGEHGGLAIVGETVIEGKPFDRSNLGPVPSLPGREAVESIIDLGRRTRRMPDTASSNSLSILRGYLESFAKLYRDRDLESTLESQIEVLERAGKLPRVFQHGDPGTWNLLATRDGRVGFLDWESAEAAGFPLWDLFYFLRSYGVTRLRRKGVRSTLTAFERTFLRSSELSDWARDCIVRYCVEVGVDQTLVGPLFYTCWMHRSLKEATRLEPQDLGSGHFVNVLRRCGRGAHLDAHLLPARART